MSLDTCKLFNFYLSSTYIAWLPLDPRFAGSNPAKDNGFLMVIKIRSKLSFAGEEKPLDPFREILWHVKEHFEVRKRFFVRQNSFPFSVKPALLLDNSAGNNARELWWMNQEFSSPWVSVYLHSINPKQVRRRTEHVDNSFTITMLIITWEMRNGPAGGGRLETHSHPIDMIIIITHMATKFPNTGWRLSYFIQFH
jgi:hypothetical protein